MRVKQVYRLENRYFRPIFLVFMCMIKFHGSITALITPFVDGEVDEDAFVALVNRQIEAGTHGLVAVGTTGESATLTHDEHRLVVSLCREAAKGRVPVIAGAGSNSTREAIGLANFAEEVGADAILAVTGYYNKPSQAGLVAHFTALHEACSLPMIIYNVPGRTVANLSVETIATLSQLPRIIAIKDATGDLARIALQRLASGTDFIQLSGEDMTAIGFNAMGGQGCISVTSNIAPELCARMQEMSLAGDYAGAIAIQDRLTPLHNALFLDTSPAPAKYALSLMGLCGEELRLPMVSANATAKTAIRAALQALDLIA